MKELARLSPYIISDEIYHGLVYEGKEHSILEFTDRAFVLNGFSKLYAMTGWRLGYLIAPREFIRPLQKIHQNFFISANSVAQWAGIAALTQAQEDVTRMRAIYNQRRKVMIKRLKELGFGLAVEPTGAFYVLANAKTFHPDSYKLAFDILKKAKVGVTPGIDFGAGGRRVSPIHLCQLRGTDRRRDGPFEGIPGQRPFPGDFMIIRSAEFIKSALRLPDFPDFTHPEVAFAGRSNVGKSSLINTLLNRKDLVRTSRRPGQTQTLNFFLVNQTLVLVDLPGYGYSKASKEVIRKYHEATITYLENRKALVLVVLLLDIRRRPNAEDKAFFDQAHFLDQGPLVVMTKADTVGREARKKAWAEIVETLGRPSLNPVFFSARTREGKEEIWKGIETKAETFRIEDRL